ncbi:hypothetical protein [Pseudomonas lopnurensis]|uniref:hypothetical protein n=1 Tax=Pseudomonas lopnurensis TaxID=1477517 RepID=UPI0028A588A0|nr:hypothetical protein [Pseudomonas lopnurensis]
MKNKNLLSYSLVLCVPLTAVAEGLALEQMELNGLRIGAELVGSDGSGSAGGAVTASGQILQLTNNDSVSVTCSLEPGPSEPHDSAPPPATMAPGERATLNVAGTYTGAPLRAKLSCEPSD